MQDRIYHDVDELKQRLIASDRGLGRHEAERDQQGY